MRLPIYLLFLLLLPCSLVESYGSDDKNEELMGKIQEHRMDKKGFDVIKTVHINWYVHSMKALIVQLSRNLLPKLTEEHKNQFLTCISTIYDKKDLVKSAKCVVQARKNYKKSRSSKRRFIKKGKSYKLVKKNKKFSIVDSKHQLLIEFKKKLSKLRKSREHLRKNRSKRSLGRLVIDSVSKSDSMGYEIKNLRKMPSLKEKSKTTIQRITGLMRSFFSKSSSQNFTESSWIDTYNSLIKLKKRMSEKEKEPGARVYNQRIYDLVLDVPLKNQLEFDLFPKSKMPDLVRKAFDLMAAIENNGKQVSKGSNYKFLSPRFASIMPDKNQLRGKLSPSIFSFYNDEAEDQILPLPKLLETTGIKGKDRDDVIEMVMEISGAKTIVNEAMQLLGSFKDSDLNAAVSENARKSMRMVEDIKKSYNRHQRKELKTNGFALVEPKQMIKLMEDQGIAGRDDIFNVKQYSKMTMMERREMVWDMIENLANSQNMLTMNPNNSTRTKRQSSIFGPFVLKPTILSPVLFTPIYGLNILGPTILSPGLFTPLILNPAVLSPYIFSPAVGIPFILSPYVLSPYVFSPLVMAPFILTPYVLSPNVFNPYVLSPLILSPLVLCPDVVSPMVLGGAILSPSVLSPSVLSKSYLMANVLSPTFLS